MVIKLICSLLFYILLTPLTYGQKYCKPVFSILKEDLGLNNCSCNASKTLENVPIDLVWFWSDSCYTNSIDKNATIESLINLSDSINKLDPKSNRINLKCGDRTWSAFMSEQINSILVVDFIETNLMSSESYEDLIHGIALTKYVFQLNKKGKVDAFCKQTISVD